MIDNTKKIDLKKIKRAKLQRGWNIDAPCICRIRVSYCKWGFWNWKTYYKFPWPEEVFEIWNRDIVPITTPPTLSEKLIDIIIS